VSEGPGLTASEVVNIGRELRAELERVAREEQGDATWLGRKLLREALEARKERD
jgi:hypothetical protein